MRAAQRVSWVNTGGGTSKSLPTLHALHATTGSKQTPPLPLLQCRCSHQYEALIVDLLQVQLHLTLGIVRDHTLVELGKSGYQAGRQSTHSAAAAAPAEARVNKLRLRLLQQDPCCRFLSTPSAAPAPEARACTAPATRHADRAALHSSVPHSAELTLQVVWLQLLQLLCHKLQDVLGDRPLILCDLLLTVRRHLLVAGQARQAILPATHRWATRCRQTSGAVSIKTHSPRPQTSCALLCTTAARNHADSCRLKLHLAHEPMN